MNDPDRCRLCRRHARLADSVLCANCGDVTFEASLANRPRHAGSGQLPVVSVGRHSRAAGY